MKNYLLFLCIALLSFSCSKEKKLTPEKIQDSVRSYIKSKIADANTYEAIAFGQIDSIHLKDTQVYMKTQQEKARLDNSVHSLKERMRSMEQTGVQQTDRLYTDLKEKLDEDERKLRKLEDKMNDYENKANEKVYSINHRYRARKHQNTTIITYDEVFYVDKNGNLIEDITVYDYLY